MKYIIIKTSTHLQIGKAAFYLNWTDVFGVLKGGVIGGLFQDGKYKIDARFNRQELLRRAQEIAKKKDLISVFNWDGKEFIAKVLPQYSNCLVYYDPPYVHKGRFLYKNSFGENDHKELSEAIILSEGKWIVTYDDCAFIRQLYKGFRNDSLSIKYSAGPTKQGNEIIIYGPSVKYQLLNC